MKLYIENGGILGSEACLVVTFCNDGPSEADVSLDRFLLNAERVGLEIRRGAERLEPLGYEIVTPNSPIAMRTLAPGEKLRIELPFKIEAKTDKVSALLFKRATYRLERNAEYALALRWDGLISNEIQITG
ncbi:MAG: hypothetical protein P0Y59_21545 [Candidatus Sphingomonas phytovorans]|nr:hypothetical protein [Sphingomonas sp.]WEJ99466.1 MAG: hypothetical protein P0Y59_21545 [Sphingomonas sp.]